MMARRVFLFLTRLEMTNETFKFVNITTFIYIHTPIYIYVYVYVCVCVCVCVCVLKTGKNFKALCVYNRLEFIKG